VMAADGRVTAEAHAGDAPLVLTLGKR